MPKHILLVEDSVTMQKVIQIAFAREDYQIVSTTSADEALARAKEHRPDIVLADTSLPGKTGYDLAAALRTDPAMKDVPILLLTGNFNPFDEQRAQRSGIDAHIVKPFDTQSIIDKVNTLVKGGRGAIAAAPAASGAAAQAAKPAAPAATAPAVKAPPPAQAPAAAAAPPKPIAAPPAAPAAAPMELPRSTLVGMPQSQPAAPPARPVGTPAQSPAISARHGGSQPGAISANQTSAGEGNRMPEPVRAGTAAAQMPQMPRPSLIPRAPVPAPVLAALERIAARGAEYDAIAKLSVEAIQQIVWEVVPELAEIIIRAEVDKLAKERKA
jgi:CheY-like chemotaxis protein